MANYNAYFVDPGEPINRSFDAINSALANRAPMQLNSLRVQEAQLRAKQDEELRSRLAAAKGQTQYGQPEPRPMSLRSLASVSGMGGQGSPLMQQAQPTPATGPTVGSVNQYTPPDLAGITAQTRLEQGRPEDAKQVIDLDAALMKMRFEAEQGGGDRMAYLKKQQQFEQGKEMVGVVAPLAANPMTRKAAEKMLALYQNKAPDNPVWQALTVDDFYMENERPVVNLPDPDTGELVGRNILNPSTGKMEFHAPVKAEKAEETWGKPYEKMIGGKKVLLQDSTRGQVRTVAQDTSTTVKVSGSSGDTGDDVEAWGRAIQEGRANLQDVPNRGTVRSSVVKWIERNGGADYAGSRAENTAYSSSLTQQQKQLGSMGSFVKNLNAQIDRVAQIGAELYTADSRLINVPIRKFRQMIAGSPQQSKYDMYITEIENEIGKLSTGSTASIAELSVGAQEKWAKIHDKNLSVKDMLQILKETKHAGDMRIKSVRDQINETRNERKNRTGTGGNQPKQDPLGIL